MSILDYPKMTDNLLLYKEVGFQLIKDLYYRKTAKKVEEIIDVSTSHSTIHNWVQDLNEIIHREKEEKKGTF